jgi:hypothetical protein
LCSALPASAAVYGPPSGKVFTGVTGDAVPLETFQHQVGKPPSVLGFFTRWGNSYGYIFGAGRAHHARVMLHLSTHDGYGTKERYTPLQLAKGAGDRYLLGLNREIADSGQPTYIRFLAEMNQANNAYCAFTKSGHYKGPSHSQQAYKQAFRRTTLILRGGPVRTINARLARLHLPRVHGASKKETLPRPPVSMAWVPQVAGTPNIPANSAQAYYPGDEYVDWVGTDFYSKFPNFSGLNAFYAEHPSKPFMFGEWAMWDGDNPGFVSELFGWIRSHARAKMVLYNQGGSSDSVLRLSLYPASTKAIRAQLSSSRYLGLPSR